MFVLLLLGAGFLYIVKNPELPISQKILTTLWIDIVTVEQWTGIDLTNCLSYYDGCNTCMVSWWIIEWCTKMFCETPAEPQCLEYAYTGIDLSGCISYFDGCNNCSVENGKPSACTEMYCETPAEPKCNEYATGSESTGAVENTGSETITTDQWYITETYNTWDKNYIKIDYVEFWAMGDGWAPDIINNNPLIRTFEVSNTAIFNVLKYNSDGGQEPQNIQRNEFETRGNGLGNPDPSHPIYYGKWWTNWSIVTIEHDSQNIYKVTEDYRP